MGDIATYVTFVAEHIAALPRIVAWWALLCALIIELSRRSGRVLAVARLLLILAALTIALLPATVYDPIAWVTLLWAIVPGFLIGWSRSPVWRWGGALAICALLAFFVLHVSKLPIRDVEALILIWIAGASAGEWLARLSQREARSA